MSTAGGRVTPLRRPPVRQSVVVRSDRRHTFGTFVSTIGIWWPVTPFSAGRDRVRDVTFEQRIFTTREAAEEFVRSDPFVLDGVVRSWTIREWNEALVPETGQ